MYDLQKASVWKRCSAALFDFIILTMVVVGIAAILSNLVGYDNYFNNMNASYEKYEQQYGIKFDITEEEYLSKTEQEKALWQDACQALTIDQEAMYAYNMVFRLSVLIVTMSILFGYLILEFAIPLIFKNGQTLGKKVFGIGVMRTDGIKVVGPLMFIRSILGKFTIETMIPAYIIVMILFNTMGIIGPIIIGLILLVQIVLIITTHTNSAIHDLLAKTVVIDLGSQMIFEDEGAMIAYKTKVHADQAARASYH